MRIIADANFRVDCYDIFVKFKIISLPAKFIYNSFICLQNNDKIMASADKHGHDTRNKYSFRCEYFRLNKSENCSK